MGYAFYFSLFERFTSMLNTNWPILIVDDEPDVLQLSKLVMQDFTVYGLPVELHTATSKAAAIELMNTRLIPVLPTVPPPRVAVAFIDVVMESNTAGLELCDYIRNTMKNKVIQLIVRTGQPGVAPERDVIDRYDINGYFTKAEATEDKLYTLVKSGVRQYLSFMAATITSTLTSRLSAAAGSRETLKNFLRMAPMLQRQGHYVFIDGQGVGGTLQEVEAKALVDHLDKLDGEPLGVDNDKFVSDDNKNMLLKIAGSDSRAELAHVVSGDWQYFPPDTVKSFLHSISSTMATLWNLAG
jgi:CheY-like chemotaxis protein